MSLLGTLGGFLGPMLGPIGSIAGGLIDAASQRHANTANAQQVQQQEQFQAQQSSTQYQRGVADLKAAGLNPAMAYGGMSDQAMSGAQTTIQPVTQNTPSKFATAIDAYNAIANGTAQRDLLREQTNATQADAHLKEVTAAASQPQAILGQDADYISKFLTKSRAQQTAGQQEAINYPAEFKAKINSLNQSTATAAATADNIRSNTTLNEQQMQNEWFRKNVAPYLNATAATIKPFTPVIKFGMQ